MGVSGGHNSIFGKTTVTLRAKIPWLVENFSVCLSYTGFDQYAFSDSVGADLSANSNDMAAYIGPLNERKFDRLTRPAGILTGAFIF